MKSFLLFLVLAVTTVCRAECLLPPDYKPKIEALLALQNPQYGKFFCEFYQPKKVVVGDQKKERCAVRCDWGAALKSGEMPLMMVTSVFVFDGEKVEVLRNGTPLDWIDGEPVREKKNNPPSKPAQPNAGSRPSSDDSPASATPAQPAQRD